MEHSYRTTGKNIFFRKNVFIYGRPYIYYEDIEELKCVLTKYGANIQKHLNDKTDLIIYSVFFEEPVLTLSKENEEKVIDESDLYKILSRLGEKGSIHRKFQEDPPLESELYHIKWVHELKQLAEHDFFEYPSLESKNIFFHGSFHRRKKTFLRLIEVCGGSIQDEFSEETDILVCGTNFSLDFINHLDQLRQERKFIIMHEALFFETIDLIEQQKKGRIIRVTPRGGDFWNVLIQECLYGNELERKGKITEAIQTYEKLLKMNYIYENPHHRLAILYRKNKDYVNELRIINLWFNMVKKLVDTSYVEEAKAYWSRKKARCSALLSASKTS